MRGMDKGSSRHVFIFFLTFYYLKQLLEKIAQTTGGMYVLVENMDELSASVLQETSAAVTSSRDS